ncbi:MAG: peptidase M23, partial [Bacillota bacterium]|nr:peptidase M23 [Bacillota bacterium]
MKKSLVTLAVSLTVGIGSLFGGYTVKTEASSIQSLKQKKNEIRAQRSNMSAHINQADQKIAKLQNQQANVEKDIELIGLAIDDTNQKISTKTNEISDTKTEIQKLQAEIAVLKERIKKRNAMLKDRARNYQENGGMVNYLDVLMGSQSFNDFVDRANAVATIMEADQEILKQHEADKEAVEKNQNKVETDLSNLQGMLSDLESMKEKMNGQVAEQKKLMVSLQKQEKETQDDKLSMEEQNSILAAQEV